MIKSFRVHFDIPTDYVVDGRTWDDKSCGFRFQWNEEDLSFTMSSRLCAQRWNNDMIGLRRRSNIGHGQQLLACNLLQRVAREYTFLTLPEVHWEGWPRPILEDCQKGSH